MIRELIISLGLWPRPKAKPACAAYDRLLYIVRVDRIRFCGEHVRRRGMIFVDPRMVIARVLDNGAIVLADPE